MWSQNKELLIFRETKLWNLQFEIKCYDLNERFFINSFLCVSLLFWSVKSYLFLFMILKFIVLSVKICGKILPTHQWFTWWQILTPFSQFGRTNYPFSETFKLMWPVNDLWSTRMGIHQWFGLTAVVTACRDEFQ